MTIYYVDGVNGNDGGNGTSVSPWKTLGKPLSTAGVSGGDVIKVRTATYYESINVTKSIRYEADAGHTPTIDCRYGPALFGAAGYTNKTGVQIKANELPYPSAANAARGNWVIYGVTAAAVKLTANNSGIKGFTIRNVCSRPLIFMGNGCVGEDLVIDFSYGGSVAFDPGSANCRLSNAVVTRGSIKIYDPSREMNDGPAGVQTSCVIKGTDNIVERCVFAYCYGEGIAASRTSTRPIIRYNICHTCNHWTMGVNDSDSAQIYGNTVYWCENLMAEMTKTQMSTGFVLGNERAIEHGTVYPSRAINNNIRFYNNLLVGSRKPFMVSSGSSERPIAFYNGYFGYNTIVGVQASEHVFFWGGWATQPHQNTLVENNIIIKHPQSNGLMVKYESPGTVTWRNNLANGAVPGGMNGAGTIVTTATAATLVNPFAPITGVYDHKSVSIPDPMNTTFNPANYDLSSGSQAIGRASNRSNITGLVNPQVNIDRYRDGRTDMNAADGRYYDIGADEFGGTITPPDPSVQAAFVMNPAATSINTGASVTFTNQSIVNNTTVTGQTWTVKRGTATIFNSTNYNLGAYVFDTAGNWSVTLTVNTAAGVSDTESVALTVTEPNSDPTVTAAFSRAPSALNLTVGASVTFTNQSVVNNTTKTGQTWEVRTSPGNTLVTSATTNNFSHTFTAAGTFVVTLTVNTAAGVSDTESVTYTISAPPVGVTADFTASATTIAEGGSITFTNTSSATGMAITGYIWGLTTDGIHVNFTTEHLTYTFSRAGVWNVNLTVIADDHVTAARDMTITVRASDSYGAGLYRAMVVPHRAAVNTTTGEQTITTAALGTLIPKAATVRLTAATANATAADGALWAEGATDGAEQWSMCRFSQDGASGGVSWRRYAAGKLVQTMDNTGALTGEAVFARFVEGGMVINVTDAFPAGYLMEVDFYAGDDVTAACGTSSIGAANTDVTVTTGFAVDFVYAATTWVAGSGAEINADISRGFALASGEQACFRQRDRHGVSPTAAAGRHSDLYIAMSNDGEQGTSSIQAHTFTTSGFRFRTLSSGVGGRPLGWLAVSLGGPVLSLATVALGTGATSIHPLAGESQTALALVATFNSMNTSITTDMAEGQGYYAGSIYSAGAEYTTWIATEDNVVTTDAISWSSDAFRAVDHSGSNKWNGAGLVDGDELVVTWVNAPATGHLMILLGIGMAEPLPENPPDDPPPTAAFTADMRSGQTRLLVRFDSTATNDNGSAITDWLWDFGDGTTSTRANPAHLYSRAGTFDVTLTVTNANGSSTLTEIGYIMAEYPKRERYLVGPIRPRSVNSALGNDMPLDWTGDEDIDARVGYHRHDQDVLNELRLMPLSSAEVAARALELDGTAALLVWNAETGKLNVIGTDGTIHEV